MISLQAGDKVLMEFSTFGDRYLSVVTDIRDDGRLLVYSPMPEPVLERLQTDKKVLVRYAHEGKLRGFKSQVLNEVETADTLLLIEKPGGSFNAEERAEPRCVCSFPATVVDGERAAQAVVEDMSATCSRVRFLNGDIPFVQEVGGDVQLTFHPFEMGEGYSVKSCIKTAFVKEGSRYAILEFKPEEDARSKIAAFIEAQVCCGIPRI